MKKNSNNLDILPNNNNNINNFKYIKDIKNNKEIIDNNNIQIQNHKTLEEKSDFSDNKVLNENNYERHTYVGNNNINIFKNNESPFNQFERHTNMIKGLQIKNMHTKNRSYGKDTHKKHKKKTGIIEQIKKEQSEKKNNGMFSTFNKRNRNIIIPNTEKATPESAAFSLESQYGLNLCECLFEVCNELFCFFQTYSQSDETFRNSGFCQFLSCVR